MTALLLTAVRHIQFDINKPAIESRALLSNLNQPHQNTEQSKFDGHLKYSGIVESYTFSPYQSLVLKNGTVWYGPTKLSADHIRLYWNKALLPNGEKVKAGDGFAQGNVSITDPLGSFTCDSLHFNSVLHVGSAKNVTIHFESTVVKADELEITPSKWSFVNASIENASGPKLLEVHLAKMDVFPGDRIEGKKAQFGAFGTKILALPRVTQNLNKKVFGFRAPFPSYTSQNGASIDFASSFLISPKTVLGLGSSLSTKYTPAYSIQLSQSFLAEKEIEGLITPMNDLGNRFQYGYFDDVEVVNPWDESDFVSQKRDTFGVATFVNSNTYDRKTRQTFDEPLVLTYEHSQSIGQFGLFTNLHLENINQVGGDSHFRGVFSTIIAPHQWMIGRHTLIQTRIDSTSYFGTKHFEWLRGEFGFVSRIDDHLRIGAGLVGGKEFGTPQFISDELFSRNGWFSRLDYVDGPRSISLLGKYDFDRHAFFDEEFEFKQDAGMFQPFIVYRLFPQALIFGLKIRFEGIGKQLQSRNPQRPIDLHKSMQIGS